MSDSLGVQWCCLTCFHKFPAGKLMINGGSGPDVPGNDHRLNCPSCRSVNVHPAEGGSHPPAVASGTGDKT